MADPSPTSIDAAAPSPFQFTLRQLLLLTVACAFGLAIAFHWGFVGFVVCYFAACALAMLWGLHSRSIVWAEGGTVMMIVGLVISCLMPAVNDTRTPSRRSQCSNHLRQIGISLQNYHDTYGSFPPVHIADSKGQPIHSWRVLILPFMEQQALYDRYRFDEPWDGPNNRKLHNEIMHVYCCPSCPKGQPKTDTSYVAVIGPNTVWPGSKATKFTDLSDGTSNTIMVVETFNSGIHWMEPRDLHMTQMPLVVNPQQGQGISSDHPNVALAVFADGHTSALTSKTPPDILRRLLTIADGEPIGDY
jgi:hypothetical protein